MSLEVIVERPKAEVRNAIYDFAARRGLRATTPWWLEGVRIEDARSTTPVESDRAADKRSWWTHWFAWETERPALNIEFKHKKGRTRVVMALGAHADSLGLAHSLRSYLQDARAFEAHVPSVCPRCSAQVPHFLANFCGRCGQPLGTSNVSIPVLPETRPLPVSRERMMSNFAPVAVEPTPAMRIEPTPAVRIERTPAEAGVDAVTPLAADPPIRVVEPMASEPSQEAVPSAPEPQRASEPSAQEQIEASSPDGTEAEPSSSNSDVATPTAAPRRAEPMVVED